MAGETGGIKFVHTADWHLGLVRYSPRDKNGVPFQLKWLEKTIDSLADYVLTENIELVLLCGDILHTRNPSPTVENILASSLRKITSDNARVIYLIGNHEIPGWGDHPAKIYDTLDVPGVIVADEAAIHKIELKSGKKIQVATIPYLSENDITDVINGILPAIDPRMPAILMMHIFIDGAKLSGSDLNILPDETHIASTEFHKLPFDYIALGHIHREQQIWSEPPAVYSGSLQRVTFAEEKEQKGFIAGQIDTMNEGFAVSWNFIPVESTKYMTLEVDIRGADDPTRVVINKLLHRPVANSVVRLKILRNANDGKVSISAVRNKARELDVKILKIERETEKPAVSKSRAGKPTGDIALDIEQYIRARREELIPKTPQIIETVRKLETND